MQTSLRVLFGENLLPWERQCFQSILNQLTQKYVVRTEDLGEPHRKGAKNFGNETVWVLSNNWKNTLQFLGISRRAPMKTFVSVLRIPQERVALSSLFIRKFLPVLPENCYLLLHSPINQRFYQQFQGLPKDRCFFLPLATPEFQAKATTSDPSHFFVGTMCPFVGESNLNYFFLVAHYVSQRNPNIKFRIFGTGPNYAHIHRICLDMHLHETVEIIEMDGAFDVPTLDAVLYAPIRNDTFSSVLTSSRAKAALLTTDLPGIEDFVEDGRNGFIVPVNDVKAAGELILRLHENRALQSNLASQLRKKIESTSSSEILAKKYEDVLLRGLGRALSHGRAA